MSTEPQKRSRIGRVVIAVLSVCLVIAVGFVIWQTGAFRPTPRVAFITGSTTPYWIDAIHGAQAAARQWDVELTVHEPEGEKAQSAVIKRMLEDGVDGIAISPIDPRAQAIVLHNAAMGTNLVTFDSDSPVSRRICFVGTDNYNAGRLCGELVKRALPDGGRVAISIGSLAKENGQRRRQGLIDELLGRSFGPGRPAEPVEGELVGDNYTIVATLVDDNDPEEALANARQALSDYSDLDCIVGLYAYSVPAVLEAAKEAGKLGDFKIVAFDYRKETLDGIEAGHVFGTITQDPYHHGFHAVRILAEVIQGQGERGLPLYQTYHFPCQVVTQVDLAAFRNTLKERGLVQVAKAPAQAG